MKIKFARDTVKSCESRSVRHDVGGGDVFFTGGSEFGPHRGHRSEEVELAAIVQLQHDQVAHHFGDGETHRDGVAVPWSLAHFVAQAAPEVCNDVIARHHTHGEPEVDTRIEIQLHGVA